MPNENLRTAALGTKMKGKIFTLLVLIGLTLAVVTWPSKYSTSNLVSAQGGVNQSCVTDCDRRKQECLDYSTGIYVTCGQQGGSEETCRDKKLKAYEECYKIKGCDICYWGGDWRTGDLGRPYYCRCGNPYYSGDGGDSGCGLTLEGGYSNPCDCNPDDPSCTSPILIDVTGDGYRLTNVVNGVRFDIRANGESIPVAWTEPGSDEAWLALDRNGNGSIDDGSDLFGNFTPQSATTGKNGFIALAEFDKPANGGNGDGLITSADSIYSQLRLWQDKNHNGVSEVQELITLPGGGVEQIDLAYKETRRMDRYGNLFRYRSKVNGARSAWDVFLTTQR